MADMITSRRRPIFWSRLVTWAALALALCFRALPSAHAAGNALRTNMSGNIVSYAMSGFEPDFDPIYRVVISGNLDVLQPEDPIIPDQKLVISAYLENFQPTTTPILPDLLHPNQTATSLGGFMTGKVAVANAAGEITYKGTALIETFLDNSAHFVMTLAGQGLASKAPPLRLRGSFTLYKNLTIQGDAQATRVLSAAELAAWSAPHGHSLSWQSIVGQLSVAKPRMMGTSGGASPSAALQRHTSAAPSTPLVSGSTISILAGVAAFIASLLIWQWPALMRLRHAPRGARGPRPSGDDVIV
jgi:hypothetical protein